MMLHFHLSVKSGKKTHKQAIRETYGLIYQWAMVVVWVCVLLVFFLHAVLWRQLKNDWRVQAGAREMYSFNIFIARFEILLSGESSILFDLHRWETIFFYGLIFLSFSIIVIISIIVNVCCFHSTVNCLWWKYPPTNHMLCI